MGRYDTAYLFAELHVSDYGRALEFYTRLFGSEPSMVPNDTESVWDLADHRSVVVERSPEHAGHCAVTFVIDDLEAVLADIASRGLEPDHRETYDNGVSKVVFHDPDGNEVGYGGMPSQASA